MQKLPYQTGSSAARMIAWGHHFDNSSDMFNGISGYVRGSLSSSRPATPWFRQAPNPAQASRQTANGVHL